MQRHLHSFRGVDKPIFELGEGEIEYGMGIHGERGTLRTSWVEADVLTEKMYRDLMADADIKSGDEICVLVNGLGSTTLLELSVVYRKLKELLDKDHIRVYDSDLNNYCTSQEMGGFSISVMKLDEELKLYYDMPCQSPFYVKGELTGCNVRSEAAEKAALPEAVENDEEEAVIVRSKEGPLEELSAEDARNMLLYIANKVIAKKGYLTEVDSATGDGDHGIGMAGGMQKMKRALLKIENPENVYEIFETAGKAMLLSMGGASGVIFGSLFYAGAEGMEKKKALKALDFAEMERKSLRAVKERGKAKPGDKTMVDALEPAVTAMEINAEKGLPEMLKAAEEAAMQGIENTKQYRAKFGRAKSLMDRAIGYQDAGATSVWLIFQGMREFVEGEEILAGAESKDNGEER